MTALETKADAEALINKEGIEYVSVRFTDLIGVQQHFTVPASEFLKDAFTDGMPFDGSSVQGFQADFDRFGIRLVVLRRIDAEQDGLPRGDAGDILINARIAGFRDFLSHDGCHLGHLMAGFTAL